MSYLHKYQKVVGTILDNNAEDMNILYIAAIFLGCKTTENLRSMRDIYNIVTKAMDDSISLIDLDKVRCSLSYLFRIVMTTTGSCVDQLRCMWLTKKKSSPKNMNCSEFSVLM